LEMVFDGKKEKLLREMKKEMAAHAKQEAFEEAGKLRNQIFALEHIRDVAMLTKEERPHFGPPERKKGVVDVFGRIEGYDISNISGAESVGSMVVFEEGESKKSEYRKFKIKGVSGINDVAMMKEVLRRRFTRVAQEGETPLPRWKTPDLILIDGGWGQVNAAREVLAEYKLMIPLVGIAKGFQRKQDRPIYEKDNPELARVVEQYKDLLLQVRDEAHRFAISYHRQRMRKRLSNR
ncbi:MAG: UvrB/UvrC motif-containing protein, partial [bacterium]|nr:UvrB/UvrC motif-containing protein [bacterium]